MALLDKTIDEMLQSLAGRHHVKVPPWEWTLRNSHYKPVLNVINVSDYYETVLRLRPEYKDDVMKLLSWEIAHIFKHYIDEMRFEAGDPKGSRILPHVERKRWLPGIPGFKDAMPRFEEEADMYAMRVTGMDSYQWERLKHDLWDRTYRMLL